MSFADPQTVNAVTLARTGSGINTGTFKSSDGNMQLDISHSYGKRNRRQIKVVHRKVAADPLLSGASNNYSMTTYLVVDVPPVGYTVAEAKVIVDALVAYLTASTGAKVTQLLGGEN